MTKPRRTWKRASLLLAIGYLLLAAATAAAFYVSWTNYQADKRDRAAQVRRDAARVRREARERRARVRQLNRINVEQCASLRNLYLVIRLTIVESDKNIDKTAYYRSHPFERRRAHMANQATINRFREPPCPRRIVVPQ